MLLGSSPRLCLYDLWLPVVRCIGATNGIWVQCRPIINIIAPHRARLLATGCASVGHAHADDVGAPTPMAAQPGAGAAALPGGRSRRYPLPPSSQHAVAHGYNTLPGTPGNNQMNCYQQYRRVAAATA
jgi:hypothetical protein